ncbi:MAG: FAD-binding oxidoreductase, partial [Butyricicoccus sp.]|nr:FAD-binding oxidoreductase [Butyricicoccus sp.]
EWAANERGYATMHYPSSLTCSTVGGVLAHRGIGVVSTKYGKIDDMTLQMEVVLPNGQIIETSPAPKHAAGPDLNQIFIGSEGTLGVITKAQMRIYDQPESRRFRGFLFQNMTDAFNASRELLQKFKPSVMRLYDPAETASLIKKIVGVEKPGAFMNIAIEGVKEIVDVEEKILLDTFKKYNAEDLGSEYGEKWWKEKITFFYPGHMMDLPQMFGTMDTIAPYDKIEKIYWAMKEAIESNFPMARFIAHFSHWYEWGCMIYDRFIVDDVPQDPAEALRLHNAIWSCGVRTALAHGGVVNDHHGVGIKLGRLMKEQYGPAMQVFEGIKKQLDPNGIMNPFKLGL